MSDFVTTDNVGTESEELGAVVSQDFSDKPLTPPSKYRSEFREIKEHSRYRDKNGVLVVMFQIDFKGGLTDLVTGRKFFRPDRHWISTAQFRRRDFQNGGFYPGTTSDVAEYLLACGYPKSQVRSLSGAAILSIMEESQTRACGVRTGLRDKVTPTGATKPNGKAEYTKTRAYTKAFLNEDGSIKRTIEKDGVTLEARESVEGFVKLSA